MTWYNEDSKYMRFAFCVLKVTLLKEKKLVESALLATTVDLLASEKRKVVDASTILPDTT